SSLPSGKWCTVHAGNLKPSLRPPQQRHPERLPFPLLLSPTCLPLFAHLGFDVGSSARISGQVCRLVFGKGKRTVSLQSPCRRRFSASVSRIVSAALVLNMVRTGLV